MTNIRVHLKYAIPLVLIGAIVYFVLFTESGQDIRHGDVEHLAGTLQSFGVFSVMVGMIAVFLQTWFPFVPFVLIAGANAFVFGLCGGFAINYSMACLSAAAAFLFARYYAHDFVEAKLTAKYPAIRSFNAKLERHGFFFTLLCRLIPVIPSSIVNFGAGVSKIRFRPFFAATLLGKLPIVALETLVGHDLLHFKEHKERLVALLVLFVVLLATGNGLKRWLLPKKKTDI